MVEGVGVIAVGAVEVAAGRGAGAAAAAAGAAPGEAASAGRRSEQADKPRSRTWPGSGPPAVLES